MSLALANLLHHKVRSLLSALAVGIGVAMLVTLLGLTHGSLDEVTQRMRAVDADLLAAPAEWDAVIGASGAPLSEKHADKAREVAAVIEKGAATLRDRGIRMGVFTLENGSREYADLSRQVPPPGVIAMVKGRGASAVSDDITESKLMQAFVAAASAGGCGPSGCGPSSPDCK